MEQRAGFVFRKSQRELLDKEPDPALRELMKDIFLDASFRKDVFVKTPVKLDHQTVFQAKAEQSYALNPDADLNGFTLKTAAGTLRFDNPAARELVDRLSSEPKALADIAGDCRGENATTADFVNTADALWAADIIRPVDPQASCRLDTLNDALEKLAAEREIIGLRAIPHGTALPCKSQGDSSG